MDEKRRDAYRFFLKDSIRKMIDFTETDQYNGVEPPPIEKPYASDAVKIDLIGPREWKSIGTLDLKLAIARRESRRKYSATPLSLEELSFLLWATQGVRKQINSAHALRTVPSAGCRHALETYLAAVNVEGLKQGIYRYLPTTHQLVLEHDMRDLSQKINHATLGQSFSGRGAVTFMWTTIPYRMEWRYGLAAHKVIAMDAGHACQNLYLACEAIGAGTCAIAAYDQEAADALLQVDGQEEFVVYMAPVGKVS